MYKSASIFVLAALSFLALTVFPDTSCAVFDLSATQLEGGFDLRFGRVEPTDFKAVRQLTVRVNSDIGKAYRVFQQLIQPLSKDDGQLIDPGQFQMYALAGSNARGSLIYGQEEPVSEDRRLVYTSDSAGTEDSFQLVYTIAPKKDQLPGSYRGRMALILVPVDNAAESQVVVNVQVYAELTTGSSAVAEMTTSSGSDRLSVQSKDFKITKTGLEGAWPQIRIKIFGPLGAPYRIYQTLEGADMTSSEGYNFDLEAVKVVLSGGSKGASVFSAGNLKEARQKQLLYASSPRGDSDEIVITYQPDADFRLARAGLYRGRLSISLETDEVSQAPPARKTFDLEFDVAPLFDIRVYSQETEGVSLRFGEVSYKSGPVSSQTQIFIESNLGKPYKVVQRVSSPMVNETGEKVPDKDFTMKVSEIHAQETPDFYIRDFQAVKEGEHIIFSSGPGGLSGDMKVEYRLAMGPDSPAGNYNTRIGYSLVLD
ncbi:MAG: hypothetical protein WC732_07705 [Candidatus Omnitrophota bacterium]